MTSPVVVERSLENGEGLAVPCGASPVRGVAAAISLAKFKEVH